MTERKSTAEKIVSGSLKPPPHVAEAMYEVERIYKDQKFRREAAVAAGEMSEEENGAIPLYAYRYEEVDGEIIEVRKDSSGAPRLFHRPELRPASKVDMRSVAHDPAGWQKLQEERAKLED